MRGRCHRPSELTLAPPTPAAQQDAFQRVWSCKEAFVKARGDGLALELGRTDFWFGPGGVRVSLDGVVQPDWCVMLGSMQHSRCSAVPPRSFCCEKLGTSSSAGQHWVTVARCHPRSVIDANGEFKKTLQARDSALLRTFLNSLSAEGADSGHRVAAGAGRDAALF